MFGCVSAQLLSTRGSVTLIPRGNSVGQFVSPFAPVPGGPVSRIALWKGSKRRQEGTARQAEPFHLDLSARGGCPESGVSFVVGGLVEFVFLVKHHRHHLNQTHISRRAKLYFSLLALNLQTSHGASNCTTNKTQKCTHKQHEAGRVGGTPINKTFTQDVPATHLPGAGALPGGSAREAQGTLTTFPPSSHPHASATHNRLRHCHRIFVPLGPFFA